MLFRNCKLTYFYFTLLLLLVGCNLSKNVPKGNYLLKKNKLSIRYSTYDTTKGKSNSIDLSSLIKENNVTKEELLLLVKPQPNYHTLGFRFKLWAYNQIDSAKVAQKRIKLNMKFERKNDKKRIKQATINSKRLARALEKGHEYYTEKTIDTTSSRLFLREWLKYKYGEKPVIFDSISFNKSKEQIKNYLKKKGYYFAHVTADVAYKKEAQTNFEVTTGPLFKIDSIYLDFTPTSYITVVNKYILAIKTKEKEHPFIGKPFDSFYLDEIRSSIAKKMRDEGFYGFTSSSISYKADTSLKTNTVKLGITITDRILSKQDGNIITTPYKQFRIGKTYFHLCDTVHLENFNVKIKALGLQPTDAILGQFVNTIESYRYEKIPLTQKQKKEKNHKEKGKVLNPIRHLTVTYNGKKPSIKPSFLELQNYLEETNPYKEYYQERSYKSLLQLGLFSSIKPFLVEIPGKNQVDVHYYLIPAEKQMVRFEPRFKNSNGFLGLSASVNYTNKNLFRGGEKLTLSFGGGFESQPAVFDRTESGDVIQTSNRSFNTFEIGPSIKLEIPGLFPVPVTKLSKRQKPQTVINSAYNFQKRDIFDRKIFQLNYSWQFIEDKWQLIQFGLPFASSIKYVLFNPSPDFEAKINQLNDPFLKNTYSNQFIWQDFRMFYELNNTKRDEKDRKNNDDVYFSSSLDLAGNTPWMFRANQELNAQNQYKIFGLGYSQFVRLDNEFIYSHKLNAKSSLHNRVQAGYGLPYGNSSTSLPYDYSFYAGGANDNRGWKARSLGPGVYKYYLDTNRTLTQVADIRLGLSVEYRFNITKTFKSCFFMDAGNIWTNKADPQRVGGNFTPDFYKQIAFAAGTGIRIDLSFFVIRFDVGIPIYNPVFPKGSRWIFENSTNYINEGNQFFDSVTNLTPEQTAIYTLQKLPKRFPPAIHFGLGFPF